MKQTPVLFIGQKMGKETHRWLVDQGIEYVEVDKNTPVEKFEVEVFDAFLFFGQDGIKTFKDSGNFPPPDSLILTNSNSTAQTAWSSFTNKVLIIPEQDELSFVQYSIARWMKENQK